MLVPVAALTLIGLVVLNTVLAKGYGAVHFDYPMNFYKQIVAVMLGVVAAFLLCLLDAPTLRLVGVIIYSVSLVLLLWVKLDGYRPVAGADSWINLPVFGSFQPSELAKIGVAMTAGPVFAAMKKGEMSLAKGFGKIALLYGLPFAMIMTEVDLGTGLVVLFMFAATLFVWGIRWRYILLSLSGLIVVVFPLAWKFGLKGAQKARILTFLFRGHDADASYHINQSLAAVASGGLTGDRTGPYIDVPVKESDFIFPALSEQFGLIGVMVVMGLALFFIVHTYRTAARIERHTPEHAYIMVALISGLAFHFIENIGMTVGLMPITGIPLPFISYGGSAMISNFLLLGVLLNLSMNDKIERLS